MIRRSIKHPVIHLVAVLAIGLVACAPNEAGPSDRQESGRQRPRSVTIGVTSAVDAMSNMGGTTSVGGWVSLSEVHSNALVTSDYETRRPVGRLAERVPSLEEGTIALLPDGRMRVVYTLRRDVLWHDGERFTADDLLFSFRFNSDPGIPNPHTTEVALMDSAEAPDAYTFVLYFKEPYYRAN